MKKYIAAIAAAVVMGAGIAPAQDNAAQPVQYLPQQGDFAVGVDVIPLLRTIGGAFNDDDDSTPVGGSPFDYEDMYTRPDVSIMGKYMLTDSWGLKVNLGLNLRSKETRTYIADDAMRYLEPLSNAQVVDNKRVTNTGCTLMAGAEYRLGQRRVQGIFGFGIMAGLSTSKTTYTYGNNITEFNRTPTTAFGDVTASVPGYRVTSANSDGPNYALGVYGSIGAEWFVAPRIALGASVDLYLYGTFGADGYTKSEGWSEAYGKLDERTDLITPGNRSINFGTDNIGGSLYCLFYF